MADNSKVIEPLIVESLQNEREILANVDYSSLQWTKSVLETQDEFQFNVYDPGDDHYSYSLCQVKNHVVILNQEYTINQITHYHQNGIPYKQITATHIGFDVSRVRLNKIINAGTITYSVDQLFSYFDLANLGYSYVLHGTFSKLQIENFGNTSCWDMISSYLIGELKALITFDHKTIHVWSGQAFANPTGENQFYYGDTDTIQLEVDSTSIVNQCHAFGMPKDDNNTSFYVEFEYNNLESQERYGIWPGNDMSDERFKIQADMEASLDNTLQLTPAVTLTTVLYERKYNVGDSMRLIDKTEDELETDVVCYGVSGNIYLNQALTYTWNNPVKTYISEQLKLINKARTTVDVNSIWQDLSQNSNNVSNMQKTIKEMQDAIKQLQNDIPDPTPPPDPPPTPPAWKSGNIFVDVSSNNGDTSVAWFKKLVGLGSKGLMVKLTEGSEDGTDYVNPSFDTQKTNGIASGMKYVGAYHFFHAQSIADAQAEANFFVKELKAKNIDTSTIVACDLEAGDLTSDSGALTRYLVAFWSVVTNSGYKNTCDYASLSWFQSRFSQKGTYSWIADWGVANAPNCSAWQFDDNWNGLGVDASKSYVEAFV